MHPVLSSVGALSWYMLAWLLVGSALAAALALSVPVPPGNALWFAVPVCAAYAFVLPSAYYVCRSMPSDQRGAPPQWALLLGSSAAAGAVYWGLCRLWNALSLALGQEWAGFAFPAGLGLLLFVAGALVYLLSLLLHQVLIASDQVREAQQRELQSQALAQQAQLQMLRAQVNPHFLFNCLNSISALTSSDAPAARAMTIALAQYFRQTLAMSQQSSIALSEEIAHCHCFLDIEMQRFGRKLAVDVSVHEATQTAQVPPMILQPLVENAVKHGIAHSDNGGTVRIGALRRDDWLHLRVENPLQAQAIDTPLPATAAGTGLGLRNIQQRLSSIYGDQARIVQKVMPDRFVVELTLPFDTSAAVAKNP